MSFTPGILYLLAIAPNVLYPLCTHLALRYLANTYHLFYLSRPLVALVWTFTLPVYWYVKARYTHAVYARHARRIGAKIPPAVQGKSLLSPKLVCVLITIRCKGKLPGNIDLLWKFFFRPDMYFGDGFARAIAEHGTTFSLTILGDYRIVTANPQNFKQVLSTEFDNFVKV
jgi:hypothetical protein